MLYEGRDCGEYVYKGRMPFPGYHRFGGMGVGVLSGSGGEIQCRSPGTVYREGYCAWFVFCCCCFPRYCYPGIIW